MGKRTVLIASQNQKPDKAKGLDKKKSHLPNLKAS